MLKQHLIKYYLSLPPSFHRLHSDYKIIHDLSFFSRTWDYDRIREWQLYKLRECITYAYLNTDGYHQLYDEAGFNLRELQNLSDINCLPMVEKSLIRDNLKSFTSKSISKWQLHKATTGGSTGIPFEFFLTRENQIAESAFVNESWESIGWKESDVGVKLRGSHIGSPSNLLIKERYRRFAISSCFLTEANYEKYIQLIRKTGASFLHVYPSSLTDFSTMIINHHDEGRLAIKHIFLGSENFYPWQKEIIKSAFPNAKLMSFYGSSEHTVFASWCNENEVYHINPIYGYTELIKNGHAARCGEVGVIVGTSFWNKGTIFIRYKSNDFASMNEKYCSKCGSQWQVLESIDGRLAEIIVGKTGRRISLTVFAGSIMHGNNFENIKQFRFIQNLPGELTLAIVPTNNYCRNDGIKLQQAVSNFLGTDFTCDLKIVTELQKSKRGKFSYLEQHLSIDRSDINI